MERFTRREYANMVAVYGEAQYSGRQAVRIYQQRFPGHRVPSHNLFATVFQRLCDTGSVDVHRPNAGRPRTKRTPNLEERILTHIEEKPTTSVRAIAAAVGTSKSTVWEVLHENELHPFKLQKVQNLGVADFPARVVFVDWLLDKVRQDGDFPMHILFTDEANFSREGIYNTHNNHMWADVNPRATHVRQYQQRYSINVWAGIVGDCLLGPYILPNRLNSNTYLGFVRDVLPDLVDAKVPLAIATRMHFQHDGAPPHFAAGVRNYLNDTFPGTWIGRGGPVNWPARSPDLTPLDFFLWGHLQSLVYETPVLSEEDLIARIVAAAGTIQDDPRVFARVRHSLVRRCHLCRQTGGRHFEHLL